MLTEELLLRSMPMLITSCLEEKKEQLEFGLGQTENFLSNSMVSKFIKFVFYSSNSLLSYRSKEGYCKSIP